jgi:hypothetical protein
MHLPAFGTEAALYKSRTRHRSTGIWTKGVDIQVGLSQLGAPAAPRNQE